MERKPPSPVIDLDGLPNEAGSLYPPRFRAAVAGRLRQRLGNAAGLTDFGVNLVELPPGCQSALRHWHSAEDEFVMVLSGALVLISDAGEQTLVAGDCAGFAKNSGNSHCLVNRSDQPARYLEIGSRRPAEDCVVYPGVDMRMGPGRQIQRADGSPWRDDDDAPGQA